MKLRNRQQVVSSGQEGSAPTSWAPRVTTLLFYGVLASIFVYAAFYTVDRLLHFRADGLVTTLTTPVASALEGRVTEAPFAAGDTVREGELLMTVTPGLACQLPDESRRDALAMDIRLDYARLEVLGERIEAVRERSSAIESWAALELDTELQRERTGFETELFDLETDRRLLELEITLKEQTLRETVPRASDTRCLPELVHAPFDATVQAVHHEVYSVVNAGEPVLSLKALRPPVVVMAYAEPRILPSLFPGKTVKVEFPDGTESTGSISAVRAASESFAQLDIYNYRLLESQVLIEVVPANPNDSERWRTFDRLGVRVSGRRGGR